MPLIIDLYGINNILILKLKVSDKEAIFRNTKRKICSKCRHPIPYTKQTKDLKKCPKCNGELKNRTLDTADTMKIRLEQYKERTYPLFDYFKKINIKIKEINGEQSIQDVHNDTLKVVNND